MALKQDTTKRKDDKSLYILMVEEDQRWTVNEERW